MKILIHASLDHKEAMVNAKKYIETNSMHTVILPDLKRYQDIRDVDGDDETFTKIKNRLTKENLRNVDSCDLLLIINETHRGVNNYIGGNSFMEMVVAFYLHKPILLLNDIPEGLPYTEEIKSLYPKIARSMDGVIEYIEFLSRR